MILCKHDCPGPICDFCRYLKPYGKIGVDLGTCLNPRSPKYKKTVDWTDACDEFHCISAEEEAELVEPGRSM